MTPPPRQPRPARARLRALLIDPRLVIGLVLVVGSVAGVVAVVTASDDTVEVFVARSTLAPGDEITADDLIVERARLPAGGPSYLSPATVPADGAVVLRVIGKGEVIPHSAVGRAGGIHLSAVVVETGAGLPESVRAGASVDLWATRADTVGAVEPPAVIASGALVVRLVESDTLVSGADTTAVELLVPKDRLARVIEALASGDALAVIPTALPLGE